MVTEDGPVINCGTCFHFMWQQDPDKPNQRGECRRYPPTPVVFTRGQYTSGAANIDVGQQSVCWVYPTHEPVREPCGEWWPEEMAWRAPNGLFDDE